jgi:hypothetical protein
LNKSTANGNMTIAAVSLLTALTASGSSAAETDLNP